MNGDPSVPVPLTADGRAEAARLGRQLAQLPLELCVHTRFARTRETADAILAGRDVPRLEEPLLDDIDVGALEGETIEDYHAWKHAHTRARAVPRRREPRRRRAPLCARVPSGSSTGPERALLVVCHEIPVRYALNAAAGSDDLDAPEHAIPNATPYLFDEAALTRAAARIAALAGADP